MDDAGRAVFEYVFEHRVGDASIAALALAVESVAAGGGSICEWESGELRVGPRSAGAWPGPACYGMGGPLTITDINLLLGRIDPGRFGVPLDEGASRHGADALRGRIGPGAPVAEVLLDGLLDLACERMAEAIRRISIRRGYDPGAYTLLAFGGAGGQHACRVSERLGISTAIVPRDAGLLCGVGLGHAAVERFAEKQVLRPLAQVEPELPALIGALLQEAETDLAAECVPRTETARVIVNLRLKGQESTIQIDWPARDGLADAFAERYRAIYGYAPSGRSIEIESCRVAVREVRDMVAAPDISAASHVAESSTTRTAWFGGAWIDADVFERERLKPGARLAGPALVTEAHATTVVEPGWTCRVDAPGALILERRASAALAGADARAEVVRDELAVGRLGAIAEEMGEMLRRTALSTNVKERLDYSCAILDADGVLVVNAPHIPVHLGALGVCVRAVRERLAMGPGDSVVTNHPAFGGSHLPDVTVITPVHDHAGTLIAYVASRAHHAEIGGSRPGSMPPDARTLADEGVVIAPRFLVHGGRDQFDELRALLAAGPHPSRAVEDNIADLGAQLAANRRGVEAVTAFVTEQGAPSLRRAMARLLDRSETRVRESMTGLARRQGRFESEQRLDDGTPIRVVIEPGPQRTRIDFTGSGPVHPGNLNATPAIVRSAVIYALRLLARDGPPLPLNEGLIRGIDLRIPPGVLDPVFVDDPARCPAVVGGNTETSQRLVDVLLAALGVVACSQGTMNNVVFGAAGFGYYETVCGGCGAGPGFNGASAVHSHMTNTRLTDPEVLERRYPVRLERFAVRRGSGGDGRFRGGDGVQRELVFLQPCSPSARGHRRSSGPCGLDGGGDGAPGSQRVVRSSGEVLDLGSIGGCEVLPGDRFILQTPGGGGYGVPAKPAGYESGHHC